MGKWFPYIYDFGMKPLEAKRFTAVRKKLLQKARGRVLEIGSGSGVNFPLYQEVQQVDAIEPSREMQKKSASRLQAASVPIYCHQQTAEQLDFADQTFDTVVSTLVFCTIPDPEKALKEIQRVAKPGAVFLFFEHVKMEQPLLAKTQDMLTPFWKKICDGCHLNRNTLALIRQAGFQVRETEEFYKGLFITAVCTYDADCL
ncbi:class I SAM-dependent methyltransferase [Heyndrickxia acidiproducens]|uniref:class I SAM-dependent methyltransferase n=1 Tax=Heyndrickxia acidiproducens TaxID=1121084 RepID=UPI000376D7F5|nr:class I SAM-dependent methyltransferase [Heyndrickxia acidiproducens]